MSSNKIFEQNHAILILINHCEKSIFFHILMVIKITRLKK